MRLWHYELLPYLPDMQLKGQWRECALVARGWLDNGTPNHLLVNSVCNYKPEELWDYCLSVSIEMKKRGFPPTDDSRKKMYLTIASLAKNFMFNPFDGDVFVGWHNKEYLRVCMANLYEKHVFGIGKSRITDEEWQRLCDGYKAITGEEYRV